MSHGLVARDPSQRSADAYFVTRLGRQALKCGLGAIEAGQRLGRSLHPRIAAVVQRQFLLGEFELVGPHMACSTPHRAVMTTRASCSPRKPRRLTSAQAIDTASAVSKEYSSRSVWVHAGRCSRNDGDAPNPQGVARAVVAVVAHTPRGSTAWPISNQRARRSKSTNPLGSSGSEVSAGGSVRLITLRGSDVSRCSA